MSSVVLEGHGAECGGTLLFEMRKRKLGGNAGLRGDHAFRTSAICGSWKTCFRDGDGRRHLRMSRRESSCVIDFKNRLSSAAYGFSLCRCYFYIRIDAIQLADPR